MAGATKTPRKSKMSDPNRALTVREEKFCHEYLVDRHGTNAAIRAGYARAGAHVQSTQILKRPAVQARISALLTKSLEKTDLKADDVIRRLTQIVLADPRKLASHHVGACRYCHGTDHQYQWRTFREWQKACDDAAAKEKPAPENTGGYGYRRTATPHPDCPECDGLGEPYIVFADTDRLGPNEAVLYEGIKQTQMGKEVKMADRARALELLASHLGVNGRIKGDDLATAFSDMVGQLLGRGSKPPIRVDAAKPPGGDA